MLEEGEHVGVRDDAGGEWRGERQSSPKKTRKKMKGQG